MSKNVILLPAYIDGDTYNIGECKKPYMLEKACAIKPTFMRELLFFCFKSIGYLLNSQC